MGDTDKGRTIKDQRRALGAANAKIKALEAENKELRKQLREKGDGEGGNQPRSV